MWLLPSLRVGSLPLSRTAKYVPLQRELNIFKSSAISKRTTGNDVALIKVPRLISAGGTLRHRFSSYFHNATSTAPAKSRKSSSQRGVHHSKRVLRVNFFRRKFCQGCDVGNDFDPVKDFLFPLVEALFFRGGWLLGRYRWALVFSSLFYPFLFIFLCHGPCACTLIITQVL